MPVTPYTARPPLRTFHPTIGVLVFVHLLWPWDWFKLWAWGFGTGLEQSLPNTHTDHQYISLKGSEACGNLYTLPPSETSTQPTNQDWLSMMHRTCTFWSLHTTNHWSIWAVCWLSTFGQVGAVKPWPAPHHWSLPGSTKTSCDNSIGKGIP